MICIVALQRQLEKLTSVQFHERAKFCHPIHPERGFLRDGEKYIYFVDNSLLFPTVKGFSESVNC